MEEEEGEENRRGGERGEREREKQREREKVSSAPTVLLEPWSSSWTTLRLCCHWPTPSYWSVRDELLQCRLMNTYPSLDSLSQIPFCFMVGALRRGRDIGQLASIYPTSSLFSRIPDLREGENKSLQHRS
jgi:hypothetical protein